ncbi:hypothetical protein BC834DRAFT_221108 [Gloeopeniophorella convolvens]|nr:hypothetical protein BC834DRAFT_221108 [Gloeopeniophorella convolvens]
MNGLDLHAVRIVLALLEYMICTFLAGIAALLSLFEDLSSTAFEFASDCCGVPPRGTFPAEKCAVLILGAQEGVGRSAALRFSELGYTVFALCPNRNDDSNPSLPSGRPTNVSSLLYTWHNKKERARSLPWGLVAPMQLSLWSRSQRGTVHDTVRAHCSAYGIHLVALIISHDSKPPPNSRPPFVAVQDTDPSASVAEGPSEEDAWRTSVLDEVTEPIVMAYDYKDLLKEASGRVIVLTSFSDGSPFSLSSLASRTAAADNLAETLEFQGIRVSSLYVGPLSESAIASSPEDHGVSSAKTPVHSFGWRRAFHVLTSKITKQLAVEEDLLLAVLRRAVQSRHPKFVYTIGMYPALHLVLRSAPVGSRVALIKFVRWVKSR